MDIKFTASRRSWLEAIFLFALIELTCAPASSAPLTNMVIQSSGGKRFTAPDQGLAIHYLVDADALPGGHSLPDVLGALSNAFKAWSDTTYIRFEFDGVQSFGQAVKPAALQQQDKRIWVQLHNLHTNISDPSQIGTGDNRAALSERLSGPNWTGGGCIDGNDFFDILSAWVALNHTNAALSSLSTLEEVLCHNIGLALGLITNDTDADSIMYYQTHADLRGARLGTMDIHVIQQAYPSNNSAPFTFDRVMEIVTTPLDQPALNLPGINRRELRGYDLQTTNLLLSITNISSTQGSFTNQGSMVFYTPNGFHDSTNVTGEHINFRFSDGVHQSPYRQLSIQSFRRDSLPAGTGDGIPDYFMVSHFGDADPAAGPNREANDDNDGDTLTNLGEYIAGMTPTNDASAQRITLSPAGTIAWQAKPQELYELQCSSNLTEWTLVKPILATSATPVVDVGPPTNAHAFYRAVLVP